MAKRRGPSSEPSLDTLREASSDLYSITGDAIYAAVTEDTLKALSEQRPANVAAPSSADSVNDPRDNETWTFNFEWTDSRGKRYAGKFTNRILSMGLLQRVASAQSLMQAGQPVESFAPAMLVINNALSHMMYSLIERPSWAKDLTALTSMELVMTLWEKVRSHEDHYFRTETTSSESASTED